MTAAVRVEGLGKRYRLGTVDAASMRADLRRLVKSLVGRHRGDEEDPERQIWAIKNVSFEIKQGEVVGIIGRNGAGKSTLLKVLSRLTRPTRGNVYVRGRTASLLEVGTGFHPELTGRENIELNGAILGMRREEIERQFDAIVDFSGVERFLDTPVKRYSSGMKVRLGFAVAAHLSADVLIVDEVLAVGDFEFQKRCLGRMREVVKGGRAVLFVSHSMDAIMSLTERCLLIEHGALKRDGATRDVVAAYLGSAAGASEYTCGDPGGKRAYFESAKLEQHDGKLTVALQIRVIEELRFSISLQLNNSRGVGISSIRDTANDLSRYRRAPGHIDTRVTFPIDALEPDIYYLTLSLAELGIERFDYHENALSFRVAPDPAREQDHPSRVGVVRLGAEWAP